MLVERDIPLSPAAVNLVPAPEVPPLSPCAERNRAAFAGWV